MNYQHRAILKRPLILVVDDVPENRSIVQRRLNRMGYDCVVADGGAAALNMIRAMSPQLVLLDFMMPEMDGPMVLREIRASPAHAHIPVIMLTARTDGASVASALDDGADDYVMKPIDFSVLKARIDARLVHHEASLSLIEANNRLDARAAAQAVELGEVRGLLHEEFKRQGPVIDLAVLSDILQSIASDCAILADVSHLNEARVVAQRMNEQCSRALGQLASEGTTPAMS